MMRDITPGAGKKPRRRLPTRVVIQINEATAGPQDEGRQDLCRAQGDAEQVARRFPTRRPRESVDP